MTRKKKDKESSGPFEALRSLKERLAADAEKEKAKPKSANTSPELAPVPVTPPGQDDDAVLLRRLFAGVEPLDRSRGRIPMQRLEPSAAAKRAAAHSPEAAKADEDAVREHLRALVEGHTRFEVADDGERVEGRRIDVSSETLRQLRRGRFPIDGRLDMHGMAIHEARTQLELFLRTTRARGERCVLVIHGKGQHSPGGTGVLRGEIAAWLSQGSASDHVAAFATAQSEDGGGGAVYVLLSSPR